MGRLNVGVSVGHNRGSNKILSDALTIALMRTAPNSSNFFEIKPFKPVEHSMLFRAWLPSTEDKVNTQLRRGHSHVGGKKQRRPRPC